MCPGTQGEGNSAYKKQHVRITRKNNEEPKGHDKLIPYVVTKPASLKFAKHWFFLSLSFSLPLLAALSRQREKQTPR